MKSPNPVLNFFIGFGLVLLGHALQILITLVEYPLFLFIGGVQLIYVIPLIFWARRNPARVGMVPGILTVAGVTFLLNAACWGLLLTIFGAAY